MNAPRGTGTDGSSCSGVIAGFLGGRLRGGHLLGAGTSTLLTWSGRQVEPEDRDITILNSVGVFASN